MDLASLRIFTTVVSEGGISAAARRLHRVQSSVSTRIQQLERDLDTALFVRCRRRMHLTPAGERFLVHAQRLLAAWDEARADVRDQTPRGRLRLGTMESTAASRLPVLLSRYHADYPDVRIELTTDTTDGLLQSVAQRALDAAFVADAPSSRSLDGQPAFSEELVLITAQDRAPVSSAAQVRGETVVSFRGGCAYRRRLEAWLARDQVMPRQVLELGSYHAIIACVAAGTGIAMVPRGVLRTLREQDVAVHPLARGEGASTTSLVWRREPLAPGLRELCAALPVMEP